VTRTAVQRTAIRLCASCGQSFTWTSRNPRRRFCTSICKARWWRATNSANVTGRDVSGPGASTSTAAPAAADTANAVTPQDGRYVAGYGDDQPPSPVQNCPNCHQPVAVINLLITPAAAYVNTPSRSVTEHS
jgi:endogenous inhibitor of DNA gyrase (YacG/DUF329 family)